MIELQLVDGRVLQFEAGERPFHAGAGPLREQDIAGIALDELTSSERLPRGPDFLLSDPNKPGRHLAIELKNFRSGSQTARQKIAYSAGELTKRFGSQFPLQLWMISLDGSSIDVSNYSEDGGVGKPTTYRLSNVSTRTTGDSAYPDQVVADAIEISTEYVIKRLDDWERRILSLYSTTIQWCEHVPGVRADQRLTVMIDEEMMQRYAVSPRKLPMLRLIRGPRVLTFRPYGLWIIGANGRLDIVAPDASYFLLDLSKQFQPPVWKLFGSGDRRVQKRPPPLGIDFTPEALRALLDG